MSEKAPYQESHGKGVAPEENIALAYDLFRRFGLKQDEQGLLIADGNFLMLENLAAWREENLVNGMEMVTPEIFDQKTLLAVSLWRQRNGESINYLLGKGAGVEVALRGTVVGREKQEVKFPYRTHSDFELYGVDYDEGGKIDDRDIGTDEFWKVFGGQEYYPTTRTKGLFNLPPDLLHQTAQSVMFGDIEVLVPELEILFLDKLAKPESTPREEGNDAELLAFTYDLDPVKLHHYAEEYIVKPALEQINQDTEQILNVQLNAITNNLLVRRKRLVDEGGTADRSVIVEELNKDFANTPLERREMGLSSNYYIPLAEEAVNDDLVVVDQVYVNDLKSRIETSIHQQLAACRSIHQLIDEVLEKAKVNYHPKP